MKKSPFWKEEANKKSVFYIPFFTESLGNKIYFVRLLLVVFWFLMLLTGCPFLSELFTRVFCLKMHKGILLNNVTNMKFIIMQMPSSEQIC